MIDLIIPHYNNQEGLLKTINSIDTNIFNILIMDDNSDKPPVVPPPFRMWYWPENCGPGIQRQRGLDSTNEPYVMFIDAGDVFISKEIQQEIAETINANPMVDIFIWPYYYDGQLTSTFDNRLHGKVYKRSFLKEHEITFCPKCSYMNEDIGFNRACRNILAAEEREIYYGVTPVINWIKNENSLTQSNQRENFYRNQTISLARTSIHTVDILRKNNIDPAEEINYIALALYYWFLRTVIERPIFMQDAWTGAREFYRQFNFLISPEHFSIGNPYMQLCASFRSQVNFPINPRKFYRDVLINEKVPKIYNGGHLNEADIHEARN